MRSVIHVALVLVLVVAACSDDTAEESVTVTKPEAGVPLTIMPIGDSTTEGEAGTPSYRCYLDGMLNEAGVSFDFVGSKSAPYGGTSWDCPAGFDEDHEGYAGATISTAAFFTTPVVESLQPDVALIDLGSVDIYGGGDPEAAAVQLESFITGLQAVKPDITLLVAQPIPCDPDRAASCAPESGAVFHEAVASLSSLSTDESAVIAVDINTGFGLDLLRDAWHPTEAGDEFIARRWMEALQDVGLA